MAEFRKVDLSNLANGAAVELFDAALRDAMANIEDVNREAKKTRTITLTVKIKPDEERKMGAVEVEVSTKLVGLKGAVVGAYFGRHQGRFTMIQAPEPQGLFTDQNARPRAVKDE